jgi:hypothetical protein
MSVENEVENEVEKLEVIVSVMESVIMAEKKVVVGMDEVLLAILGS